MDTGVIVSWRDALAAIFAHIHNEKQSEKADETENKADLHRMRDRRVTARKEKLLTTVSSPESCINFCS